MTTDTQSTQLVISETSILDGIVFAEDTQQWMDWIEAYHAWLESKRRRSGGENTVKTYATAWKQFFRWAQTKPWDVTARLVERWVVFLAIEGKEVTDPTHGVIIGREALSESSINLKLAALSSFYSFVQKSYDLWPADQRNPFMAIERHRVNPYDRAKYPSIDECQTMLEYINHDCLTGKRDLALLHTLMTTCRRSSEILNLQWGDLQETAEGDYSFTYRYKGGVQKKAILPKDCYRLVTEYLTAAGRLDDIQDEDYIFTALDPDRATRLSHINEVDSNRPLSNGMVNRILKKYGRRAGVDRAKCHVHGLRHAGARLRVQQMREGKGGVDLEELMHLLGHSSLAITQIYVTNVLDDPVDAGGTAAAQKLLPKGKPRRRKKSNVSPQQLPLEAALSSEQLEIARLKAELAQLKAQNER